MVGGHGPAKTDDDGQIAELMTQVRPAAETMAGKPLEPFAVHSFTQQVVAGMNYRVKVHVGGEEYAHVDVHKPLPHTGQDPQVKAVALGKTVEEAI